MLESMTSRQYREWLAFFNIRAELEKAPESTAPGKRYAPSPEGQKMMQADLLRAMTGYQQRRDKKNGAKPR